MATALLSANANECRTAHFTVVSQQMKGTRNMTQRIEAEGKPPMDMVVKMKTSSSIDIHEFNMVESVEGTTYVNDEKTPFTMDLIVNWKQGDVTQRFSAKGQDPACHVMKLPPFVTEGRFMDVMGLFVKGMEKRYSCAGDANGMDTYTMDFPPHWLLPLSPVEVHTKLDVDQDLLVHKETIKENIDMQTEPPAKAHVESTFVSDKTRAGGPTTDEMVVPDSWGPCEEHVLDIDEMLKPFAEDIDRARFMRAVGAFRKLLHAVHFAESVMHSETVV